jgi:RNA polymerase sigma factor (sigma-70 family)
MLHHNGAFTRSVQADRRTRAELERLLAAAGEGDERAWTTLGRRFGARLRAVARAHRLAAHDVEDVVQTTWLRLVEHIHRIRDARALGAWLETTARRESLRILRGARRELPTDDPVIADVPAPPVERDLGAERAAALADALTRLPERQRALMSLLTAEPQPSYTDIAQRLEMPIGSIGPTRQRCLARLRRDMTLVHAVRDE